MSAPLLELALAADALEEERFDLLADRLHAVGRACEYGADGVVRCFKAWFTPEADMRERLIAAMALFGVADDAVQLTLLDESWETAWQKQWRAQRIGRRLWVRPSFCDPAPEGMVDLELTPGMAFGTGTHPTTQLCLEAVEQACVDLRPQTLLDMGAGSGILAIAAARLGVPSVLAVDCDADAVAACRDNARINGVAMVARQSDRPPERRRFDLVVANILSEPLIAMAEPLAACVGRRLLLSGLLQEQVVAVEEAYARCGLVVESRCFAQEWALLALRPGRG